MKGLITVGVSVVGVGAVVAGSLAASAFLSGGGTQPEDVLPASTIGFVKVDLNPSASQKLNVLRLMSRFPDVKTQGEDLKATVVESMLDGSGIGLDYEKDIEPWLGDRAAVAALPATRPDATEPVTPLVVIEFTDEDAMSAALDKAEKTMVADHEAMMSSIGGGSDATAPGTIPSPAEKQQKYDPFDYAVRGSYVLLSAQQAAVDAMATAEEVLADTETFSADEAAIDGGDQIVLAWLDVHAAYQAVPEDERADFAEQFGSARPAGRMVLGVHAEPDAIEAVGRTIDLEAAGAEALAAGGSGTGLITDLPTTTDVAFSATGLGDLAVDLWDRHAADPYLDLADEAEQLGLEMPEDLDVVLGEEAALGVDLKDLQDLDFSATARVRTAQPDRALEILEILAGTSAEEFHFGPAPEGFVAGIDRQDLAKASDGDRSLGAEPRFSNALPAADEASVALYVDIASLVDSLHALDEDAMPEFAPLEAFGATATGEAGNGSITMRLTFR